MILIWLPEINIYSSVIINKAVYYLSTESFKENPDKRRVKAAKELFILKYDFDYIEYRPSEHYNIVFNTLNNLNRKITQNEEHS